VARTKVTFDTDTFFAFLNSKDDLTAVVHGVSSLDALLREGLERLLDERGLKPIVLDRLRPIPSRWTERWLGARCGPR
jgi:hypothetical protein